MSGRPFFVGCVGLPAGRWATWPLCGQRTHVDARAPDTRSVVTPRYEGALTTFTQTTFTPRLMPRKPSAHSPTLVAEKALVPACFNPLSCDIARFEFELNIGTSAILEANTRRVCLNMRGVIQC